MKLTLQGIYLNPYNSREICAHVYYESNKISKDQDNKEIGLFMSNEQRDSLASYLRNFIKPKLNLFLRNHGYECTLVDYVIDAPHPVLILQNKAKSNLSDLDIKKISHVLNSNLETLKQVHFRDELKNQSIFLPKQKPQSPNVPEIKSHYSLRNRQT